MQIGNAFLSSATLMWTIVKIANALKEFPGRIRDRSRHRNPPAPTSHCQHHPEWSQIYATSVASARGILISNSHIFYRKRQNFL